MPLRNEHQAYWDDIENNIARVQPLSASRALDRVCPDAAAERLALKSRLRDVEEETRQVNRLRARAAAEANVLSREADAMLNLEAKERAIEAFNEQNYKGAVDLLKKAIKLDPDNHIFFSNRAAAHMALEQYDRALVDADECIRLQPTWAKGYSRRGAALFRMDKLGPARDALERTLTLTLALTLTLTLTLTRLARQALDLAPQDHGGER